MEPVKTNEPTNAYVAVLAHYPNPLSLSWENTGMSLTLLQLDKNQTKGSKRLVAKKSSRLVVYKRSFNKARIQIKLNKFGINTKGVPMVVFFDFDTSAKSPLICTGKEDLVSQSTGKYFDSCASSSDVAGYKCEDGFSGKLRDEEGGVWAANSDGVGAWLSVKFKGVFKITKIQVNNRNNPTERNSKLELLFSSGETQFIHLKNDDKVVDHLVESIRANGLKFIIRGVYGTNNNGGAFNVWGVKCRKEIEEDDELDDSGSTQEMAEKKLNGFNTDSNNFNKQNKNGLNNISNENIGNKINKNSSSNDGNNKLNSSASSASAGMKEEPLDPSLFPPLFTKDKKKPISLSC